MGRGHTLVEVLVVTAIVIALLAVLFPVLSASKRQALSTQETAQLKQLAVAHDLYLADHDDVEPGSATRIIAAGYAPSYLVALALDPFPEGWANVHRSHGRGGETSYKDSFLTLWDATSDGFFTRFAQSENGGWIASFAHGLSQHKENVMLSPFTYKRLTFGGAVIRRTNQLREVPTANGPQLGTSAAWLFSDDDVLKEFRR